MCSDQCKPTKKKMNNEVLGVVVITRNEQRHIAACLNAVMDAVRPFRGSPVVLVDSDSTDATIATACRYPVTIYRYRGSVQTAAAGRRIGFERVAARYVLFVDGDCCIESKWVMEAVELLESSPTAAVVYGARREVYEDVTGQFVGFVQAAEEFSLGGNAMYRAKALKEVNGFNPFVVAEEERELFGRLQAAHYTAIKTHRLMITHHTAPKNTVYSFLRRHQRELSRGPGQVLRLSIGQGLFLFQARRFNRYLFMVAYLTCGVVTLIFAALAAKPELPLAWSAFGLLAFGWVCLRQRSLRAATYIVADWASVAVTLIKEFLKRPTPIEKFTPVIERIQ